MDSSESAECGWEDLSSLMPTDVLVTDRESRAVFRDADSEEDGWLPPLESHDFPSVGCVRSNPLSCSPIPSHPSMDLEIDLGAVTADVIQQSGSSFAESEGSSGGSTDFFDAVEAADVEKVPHCGAAEPSSPPNPDVNLHEEPLAVNSTEKAEAAGDIIPVQLVRQVCSCFCCSFSEVEAVDSGF